MIAKVPEGMSYVNAFYALYQNATCRGQFFAAFPDAAESLDAPEKVTTVFQKCIRESQCYVSFDKKLVLFVDYAGGKCIKVHFDSFSKGTINVEFYDSKYGLGTGQKVLDAYNATPKENRFDPNDRCDFQALFSTASI